ncbi:MAG: 5-guanidino-2-oxopentanoate decarboxylase [Gammaproteobacteria bacterium]|nr:5-guanidino-2-oxopentanoate decarboxylase [Gammaproteobacteria bacterium]
MHDQITCGEATIRLLEKYGVDTVFGIPGVHTLDLYRGLANSPIQHVQARHEQGAGFMADGYARVTGKPGVCLLISGPGVTNGLTAIGQAYADSIPVLMISSTTASYTLGKGWGCLHEVSDLQAVTAPLTGLSATALSPADVPELIGQAFSIFASERPRPVHITIPIDVLAMPVKDDWLARRLPTRPMPSPEAVEAAADLLAQASRPLIMLGGGAIESSKALTSLAELLNAAVISSNAGKGIVPDSHPLNVGGGIWRAPVQNYVAQADVILAIGTELSETDSFIERLNLSGQLIRVDIDPRKINDLYPADIGIVADAGATAASLLTALQTRSIAGSDRDTTAEVAAVLNTTLTEISPAEAQHLKVLHALREALPGNTVFMGDITQLVYTGSFALPVEQPRLWHYPAGYCTLGCGLPNGIGAKLALPEYPVVVLAGDGGFMFTVQELITAAELGLSLPIIIWENGGLLQIKDDMNLRNIPPVGVAGINPDFMTLAKSMGCYGLKPDSMDTFTAAVTEALQADRPTVIELNQGAAWLV